MDVSATLAAVQVPLQVGAALIAVILIPCGIWMLWGGRDFTPKPLDDHLDPPPPPRSALHGFRDSLSRSSRTAFGLCSLIVAWHAIAYTQPQVHLIHVPIERWWVLALGVLIVLWSSLAMDRAFR